MPRGAPRRFDRLNRSEPDHLPINRGRALGDVDRLRGGPAQERGCQMRGGGEAPGAPDEHADAHPRGFEEADRLDLSVLYDEALVQDALDAHVRVIDAAALEVLDELPDEGGGDAFVAHGHGILNETAIRYNSIPT